MKGILVILDGMGDLPNKILDGKTPLEAASTPNLDFLATRGEMGMMFPVKPDFIPESDEAIVSIFGNKLITSTRGQLEAHGVGIDLTRGDLAFRTNFATIDNLKDRNVIDRRAGRTLTNAEAETLAKAINTQVKIPVPFHFEPTVGHRGVLVFRGGLSDNITGNGFAYIGGKIKDFQKIGVIKPMDDDENSQYTSNIVNDFLEKVYDVLDNHPVNIERKKAGLLSANYLLLRGPGIEPPKFFQYKNWMAVAYMPLESGFARLSGMQVFDFEIPKLKKLDFYENLYDVLKKACKFSIKMIKKNHKKFDYAYIHIKETDIPGHDNKPFEKKEMLEYIDKFFFNFLRKFAPPHNILVVVTADHATPCKLKTHSDDAVPVLFYNSSIPKEKKFNEKEARLGTLGRFNGDELFKKVGFEK